MPANSWLKWQNQNRNCQEIKSPPKGTNLSQIQANKQYRDYQTWVIVLWSLSQWGRMSNLMTICRHRHYQMLKLLISIQHNYFMILQLTQTTWGIILHWDLYLRKCSNSSNYAPMEVTAIANCIISLFVNDCHFVRLCSIGQQSALRRLCIGL